MYRDHFQSPIGLLEVTADEKGMTSAFFVEQPKPVNANLLTHDAVNQLKEYFLKQRISFDLPISIGGTSFQMRVWQALRGIQYGQTRSYKDIAEQLDNPKAVRAVGSANGKNPLSIIVPCHRVIGANGKLSGYAGGVDRKAWLLALESQDLLGL